MKHIPALLASLAFATAATAAPQTAASVTSNYITWTFDKEYPVGQFVNGDWYVLGPAKIVAIDNSMSDKTFMPTDEDTHVHGSMINPAVEGGQERKPGEATRAFQSRTGAQGYDSRVAHYVPELNASRPGGNPLSKDNPLALKPDQSLVSLVSWLWRSPDDKEEGSPAPPRDAKGYARPTMRAGAVLTCLAEAPPAGTFRPGYAGNEKRLLNISQLKRDRLLALPPVEGAAAGPADIEEYKRTRIPSYKPAAQAPKSTIPGQDDELSLYYSYQSGANIALLTRATARPWIDHIPDWYGGSVFHPSINFPNYGRELCNILQTAMLALHIDWTKIPDAPATKDDLLINMCQIGIDFASCADAGTWWPSNGGHHAGRKPAILFAGLLLDDKHMMNVGNWDTVFQENQSTNYVTQEQVDHTNSDAWRPEIRGAHTAPYGQHMLGMPEWNFAGNSGWNTSYRGINIVYFTGFALVAHMMDARKLWNHEAFFDYTDRAHGAIDEATKQYNANRPPAFVQAMWDTYRKNYPSTYDAKKWDDPAIIAWCTTPTFLLRAAPKKYGIFELKDDEPIRMTVGAEVDLTALNPKTVTVTAPNGEAPVVAAIETAEKTGDTFTIRFAEGTQLKPGTTYTVTVDEEVSGKWRNAIGMRPLSNKTTFTVR